MAVHFFELDKHPYCMLGFIKVILEVLPAMKLDYRQPAKTQCAQK
jgi:hypothetical protein